MTSVPGLPADLRAALSRVARVPRLLVTSDFDGTLAPIVNNPADARALPGAVDSLRTLAQLPATAAALISGRSLAVLTALSGSPAGVHLIGSHGAEFGSGFAERIDTELVETIRAGLQAIADEYPGTAVETKPAGVVLHVRNATPRDADAALAATRTAARSWPAQMTEGKAVLEFAVITTDKGDAIDVLRSRERASAVVFFGDDVTDEKAFRQLAGHDVGVKVGPGDTLAGFRVDAPEDVAEALAALVSERARR